MMLEPSGSLSVVSLILWNKSLNKLMFHVNRIPFVQCQNLQTNMYFKMMLRMNECKLMMVMIHLTYLIRY